MHPGDLIQMHCLLMHFYTFFIHFLLFSLIGRCLEKIQASKRNTGSAILGMPKLVSQTYETTSGFSIGNQPQTNTVDTPSVPETPPVEEKV